MRKRSPIPQGFLATYIDGTMQLVDTPYLIHYAGMLTRFSSLVILLVITGRCFGQNSWPKDEQWEVIKNLHDSRRIEDTVYLERAQALTELSFKNPGLKDKLSKYKNIAWSNQKFQKFRVRYYAFLANHTASLHQDGYTIYYLQKMEEELKMIKPYINSLNQPRQLLAIYGDGDYNNYDKRIEILNNVIPFLKTLPDSVAKGSFNINTCINAFIILKHAIGLYAFDKNIGKVLESRDIARNLLFRLKSQTISDKGKFTQCQLSFYLIESDAAKFLGKDQLRADYLNSAYVTIVSNEKVIVPFFKHAFEGIVLGRLIDYYIKQNQIDSAQYFLALYRAADAKPNQLQYLDGTRVLKYAAKLEEAKSNYKTAYENISKAYAIKDSVTDIRIADINNNMYAHLVAEHAREKLMAGQVKITQRNFLIFGIATVLIATVIAFSQLLKINKRRAARRIEKLNESTQIQIAELESHANEIQRKLGMELHDDIAGRLVYLINSIDSQMLHERDNQAKVRLSRLLEIAQDTYNSTRSKSHDWYFQGYNKDKTLFSDRVRQIVSLALADSDYEKTIEIDDECTKGVPVQTRIQLLRIIQEAVANILKHAKADRVKLFIYQDEGVVVLQVADNGRGFNTANIDIGKGLGIASLQARVTEINGTMEISSSDKGTELLFNVPLL